jgi:hypothetical protein
MSASAEASKQAAVWHIKLELSRVTNEVDIGLPNRAEASG